MFSVRIWTAGAINKTVFRHFASLSGDKTSLYNFHVEQGGKIVNFGGYLLPVQYSDQSIVSSHLFTRKNASIFDVSHMLQTEIRGQKCVEYFESLCTADIQRLKENSGTLTVFTNENGGILDDLIVTKVNEEHLYVVSNAAMRKQDQQIIMGGLETFRKLHNNEIQVKFYAPSERALLALQGPKAVDALQKITDADLNTLYFMNTLVAQIGNVPQCRITRCGYTGEDGFEISLPADKATELANVLLKNSDVKLAGLGARDSLRLEAGLCLYGSDIMTSTTPVEAALTWLISKRRRQLKDFPGAEVILQQIKNGSKTKRVGLTSTHGPPPRHGAKILSQDGQVLGDVTSGCPSPSLGVNVAMGYVPTEFSKPGTKLSLRIRDKVYEGLVTKMPFVKSHYYNKPK